MKKLLLSLIACLALVLVPAFAVCGCKKKTTSNTDTSRVATKKYTINFVVKDMGYSSVSLASEGEKLTEPDLPKSSKYKFDCWCTDSELTQYFNTNTPITDNMTLYGRVYDSNLTIAKKGDHAAVTFCKEKAKTVNIPMRFRNLIVTEIDYAFHNSSIEVCTIPNNITQIGEHAFWRCKELISITISNGVKSIGAGAFSECTKLENIYIPNSVTSIGNAAFSGCTKLSNVVLSQSLTELSYNLFNGCSALEEITIPENVTNINGSAFSGCSALEEITIPDGVISIGESVFSSCSSLINVTIGGGFTAVSNYAFSGCSSLTEITIPNNIKSIGYKAFSGCSSLTSVTIPDSVTAIGHESFSNCSSLTSIIIPESVTSIDNDSFYCCNSLESITLPAHSIASLFKHAIPETLSTVKFSRGQLGGQLSDCSGISTIIIGKNVTKIEPLAFSDCESLATLIVEEENSIYDSRNNCNTIIETATNKVVVACNSSAFPSSVTDVYTDAFCCCNNLQYNERGIAKYVGKVGNPYFCIVEITDKAITTIGNILDDVNVIYTNVFYDCDALTSVTISSSVVTIGEGAFNSCTMIGNLTIGNHVKSIGDDAFNHCTSLTSIVIPNSVVNIGERAFCDCIMVENLTIGTGVKSIGRNAFQYFERLTSIVIPNSVETIDEWAFGDCLYATSLTIGSGLTYIGTRAFYNCIRLATIKVNANNSVYDSRNNCNAIIETATNTLILGCNSTEIPSTVTSIGDRALVGYYDLTSITIPASVTNIVDNVFSDCHYLESIEVSAGNPVYDSRNNCNAIIETATNTLISGSTNTVIPSTVTKIGKYAFYGIGIQSITIPTSVTSIDYGAFGMNSRLNRVDYFGTFAQWCAIDFADVSANPLQYGKNLYINNTHITEITANDLAGINSIGANVFCGLNIENITIPNHVKTIGQAAFQECRELKNVIIGSGVTSIGEIAFYYCTGLTSVTIPNSVTSIGYNAFGECDSLATVAIDSANIYVAASGTEYNNAGCLLANATTVRVLKTSDNGSNTYLNNNFTKTNGTGEYSSYFIYTKNS